MHSIPWLPLSSSWKYYRSEVRFFHCKWKSRTECCPCPDGRAQCVGASMGACMTLCFLKRIFHRALLYLIYCTVCTLDSASSRWPNTKGDAAPTAASYSSADMHVIKCTQTLVCIAGYVLWKHVCVLPSLLDCLYLIVVADVTLNRGFY